MELVGLTMILFIPLSLVIKLSAIPKPKYSSLPEAPKGVKGRTATDGRPVVTFGGGGRVITWKASVSADPF